MKDELPVYMRERKEEKERKGSSSKGKIKKSKGKPLTNRLEEE